MLNKKLILGLILSALVVLSLVVLINTIAKPKEIDVEKEKSYEMGLKELTIDDLDYIEQSLRETLTRTYEDVNGNIISRPATEEEIQEYMERVRDEIKQKV